MFEDVRIDIEKHAEQLALQALHSFDPKRGAVMHELARELLGLIRKSAARIEALLIGIQELNFAIDAASTRPVSRPTLPSHWDEGFEPRAVNCLRLMGELLSDQAKADIEELAVRIVALEEEYVLLYQVAQDAQRDRHTNPVGEELSSVLTDRVGCYCCAPGCHICTQCQPFLVIESSLRDLRREIRQLDHE